MNHPSETVVFAKGARQILASGVAPKRERLETDGKTVEQVFSMLSSALRRTALEPEWLCPANMTDDPDEATSGARFARLWPDRSGRARLAVSVDIGMSEGWIIHVDWISRPEIPGCIGRGYAVMPLLCAKVFTSDHAWELARFIAQALDVA
ncbi:hypothetical protein [Paraburkholderia aromaticivorans]|uniref:hypothetical protein n=1 Tax=Paraburkholderia aromaticivorans TaxID=2026199 RepID=UPI0038B98F88